MNSIEIILCLIAIVQVSPKNWDDIMPSDTKSADLTFPLLTDMKITFSGKWGINVVTSMDPILFTDEDVVSLFYELDMNSIRLNLEKNGHELLISAVVEEDDDKVYFKYIQLILKAKNGGDHYFNYDKTYEIEKKDGSYYEKYDYLYAYNRNKHLIESEVEKLTVSWKKFKEPLFGYETH
ncbi:hypothetical protein RF11_09970 [Thelohanellus kitauei]|uniref:Uncharacterized protein n=1 Tax=Thelohanellus kitauei TaxID=669202 RepID=A0A0C2NA11_THEKT|nr:hypothetical protein RF11_09970 [Thelohanellus kitauei]